MPIPREILNVPRPKNTVVIAYGRDKKLYAVRQRVGCRNVGGRHLPVNLAMTKEKDWNHTHMNLFIL